MKFLRRIIAIVAIIACIVCFVLAGLAAILATTIYGLTASSWVVLGLGSLAVAFVVDEKTASKKVKAVANGVGTIAKGIGGAIGKGVGGILGGLGLMNIIFIGFGLTIASRLFSRESKTGVKASINTKANKLPIRALDEKKFLRGRGKDKYENNEFNNFEN